MKKLSALLLSSFVLSLAACDSGDDGSDTNATSATDTDASGSASDTDASGSASDSNSSDPSAGDSTGDGETGDPTDTADPTGGGDATCQYRCSADEDCLSGGMDIGLTCTDSGFCLNVCESDDECIAQVSGWGAQPCDSNDTCGAGPCVDLGDGTGGCGTAPSEFIDCATLMMEETEVTDIDGNPATVCANTSAVCEDVGTGDTICTVETEVQTCQDVGCPEGFTCADDGVCRCDSDDVCNGGVCNSDGFCINPCSSASDCDAALPFDGGEYVCE